jgi:hypothetical protein
MKPLRTPRPHKEYVPDRGREASEEVSGILPGMPLKAAEPPECPEGWRVGPPDFVGVGAQRCGTTWWHGLIAAHPGVSFERGIHAKEIHFFDALGDRAELSCAEIERYHRYFPRPPEQLAGEWTPRYMQDPWISPQLAQAAPATRVLVLLRDPIDRFASGYARGRRLAADRGDDPNNPALADHHVALGMYFDQVRRVLDEFARERVLILQYERCREQHASELRRTYEFLGLDPQRAEAVLPPRGPRERSLSDAERRRLAEVYAPDVRRLAELVPELDVSLWRNVAGSV